MPTRRTWCILYGPAVYFGILALTTLGSPVLATLYTALFTAPLIIGFTYGAIKYA